MIFILSMMFVTSCSIPQGVTSNVTDSDPGIVYYDIELSGGSGRAYIESPVRVHTTGQKSYATLVWSSENYDYVLVGGIKYINENPGGRSTFTVPVDSFDVPLELIGDTTAMSKPHEIEYSIRWLGIADAKSAGQEDSVSETTGSAVDGNFGVRPDNASAVLINGSEPDGQVNITKATGFDIFKYGKYRLIRIYGVGDYLLVPDKEKVPDDLPEDVTVIYQPVSKTYLVSTSVMDLVRQIGALDSVRLSGLDVNDWYIKEARDLMNEGKILYAGKYRAPDYELILSRGCDLAIENTMIYHDPEVKEKLEELGIPVIVETSSYEADPLGRLEWIKLYGVLFDKEEEANDFYESRAASDGAIKQDETGKSVACFYVSAAGMINVRVPGDYVTKMIEMAGAKYVPDGRSITAKTGMGTLNMQMEDFYADAKDADILLYNLTIDGDVDSIADLVAKNALFSDFKAVSDGNVYCLRSDFFQRTTKMTDFVEELHDILENGNGTYTFFTKLY